MREPSSPTAGNIPGLECFAIACFFVIQPAYADTEPQKQFAPEIDDPMHAPAPRPAKEIASWEEADQILRTRST